MSLNKLQIINIKINGTLNSYDKMSQIYKFDNYNTILGNCYKSNVINNKKKDTII